MITSVNKSIHTHFTTIATSIIAVLLTGFVIKFVSFYFPFGNQEFFSAIHLSWNKVAYVLSLLVVPPYILFTWQVLFHHLKPTKSLAILYSLLSGLVFISLLYYVTQLDLRLFYFWTPDKLITYTSWKTHLLAIFFFLATLTSYYVGTPISTFLVQHTRKLILGIMVIISLYLANFAVLNDLHKYNTNALNLSVVIHPIIQVFYGKAVLIDQKTQYGLYAQLLEPVLHLMGGVSIFKISLIMASLLFISFLAIGVFLLQSVHPILALIGFCATIYFNYFAGTLWPYELYFQYYPIRTIVPTLALALSWYYFSSPSRWKFYSMLIFLSLGIIWNLDVGLFAFLSFVAALLYHNHFRQIIPTLVKSGLVFVAVFSLFLLYLRLRYHIWPDVAELVSAQKLFLSGSILELKRLWTIVILIYLVGLVHSAKNIVLRQVTTSSTMIFFTSILGLGIFTYGLNNPHDSVLTNCAYPSIIVLTLLVHEYLIEKFGKFTLLTLAILTLLSSSFFVNLRRSLVVRDAVTIESLTKPKSPSLRVLWDIRGKTDKEVAYVTVGDLALNPSLTPVWMHKANMASRYALPGGAIRDDLLVLSNWDYLLYLKAHAKSPLISVNFRHLYLDNEWELLFDQLKSKQNLYVLVDNEWGLFQGELKNHPNQYIDTILSLLKANYHPIESLNVGYSWYLDRWYPSEMVMYQRN